MTTAYDPDPPARIPRVALVASGAIALALVALAVLVPEVGSLLPRSSDQQAVAVVVERVIVANQTAGIPTQRDQDGRVPLATVDAMHAQVRAVAAQFFIGPLRDRWIEQMDDVIDLEVSSEFIFEGGAHDFGRWHIAIDGGRATVQVRCSIFLVMAQTADGRRARAENTVDYELTLQQVGATWFVDSQSHNFAPGGGP